MKAEESCDSLFFFGLQRATDRWITIGPSSGHHPADLWPEHLHHRLRSLHTVRGRCVDVLRLHFFPRYSTYPNMKCVKAHKSRDVSLYLTHLWHNSSIESLNPAIKVDGTNPKYLFIMGPHSTTKIGVTFWISWIHSTCAREYFEQAGIPQGPTEAEEMDPFQATRDAMTLGKHVEVFFLFPCLLEKNCWQDHGK